MYFLAMYWVWYVKLYCARSLFLQNWDKLDLPWKLEQKSVTDGLFGCVWFE